MKKVFIFLMLLPMIGYNQVANYGYTSTTSTWGYNSSPTVFTGLGAGINDALSTATNIGFTFTYNSVAYTQFKVSTNGFLTFNTANTLTQPTNNLKTSTDRVILAVLWDDCQTASSTGNVNYQLTGISPTRVLTVEWYKLRWNKNGFSAGTIDCQIKLYESTNVIEYIYNRGTYQSFGNSTIGSITASIGLGGATLNDFLSLSDIKASPTKSTSTETSTIGYQPTELTTMTQAQANTQIPNGTKYRFYPPITNDNCSGGTSLTVNSGTSCTTSSSGSTIGATQSIAACVGTADDDVWYTFVATQPVHLLTETPVTIGDAVMQVYSGSCASLSTIACINDATTGNETTTLTGLTIGNTYFVRVHSFASGSGQGTFTMCVTTPPTIITSGAFSEFNSCSGSVSTEQSYTISGSGLIDNITITAPIGFELSTTSGNGFTTPLTLTQTSGIVSLTTIYVRLKSNATGSPSGNIINSSSSATTQNISVSGTLTSISVGGTVISNQNVNSGDSPNDISLTGNNGSVVKWISSPDNLFTTTTDILVTNTTLLSNDMGPITSTTYYRAIVKNGVCIQDNSSYVKMTVLIVLPIELLYFKVNKFEGYNHLTWSTSSEHNNYYFNIEKTQDGVTYHNMISINGAGNTNNQSYYEYDDYDVNNDINYYRLKQTDFDGVFKYHDIISVDNSNKIKIVVRVINLYGTEVDIKTKGVLILIYDDGTINKLFNE